MKTFKAVNKQTGKTVECLELNNNVSPSEAAFFCNGKMIKPEQGTGWKFHILLPSNERANFTDVIIKDGNYFAAICNDDFYTLYTTENV